MPRTPDGDSLRLDQQVCFPLYAASNLLTRLYRPLLDDIGLTYPQYLVMLALWESSPAAVGELGERLYLDSGTLTPLLKRLELAGLVLRQRSDRDERRVLVSLTRAGRSLRAKAQLIPPAIACSVEMSAADLAALRTRLRALVQTMAQARVKPSSPAKSRRRPGSDKPA